MEFDLYLLDIDSGSNPQIYLETVPSKMAIFLLLCRRNSLRNICIPEVGESETPDTRVECLWGQETAARKTLKAIFESSFWLICQMS